MLTRVDREVNEYEYRIRMDEFVNWVKLTYLSSKEFL